MDPFLEHPSLFPDLHSRLITNLSEAIQSRLPEPYFAVVSERLWVEASGRHIEPDVDLMQRDDGFTPAAGGVALALPATRTQPIVITVEDEEFRELFVEIRARRDDEEIVITTIEILSLANKTPGSQGRDLYQKKQREVLGSRIHFVEIDLLRGGRHATAMSAEKLRRRAAFDYHVRVHQFHQPRDFLFYPIDLADRLPEIAVPLLPKDGAVAIDLQAVFDRCYDAGPYRRRVRYEPSRIEPPLSATQAEWVSQVLREKGLLT
jgi:hypothetical protein